MNSVSRLIKTHCPGWFAEATVFLQLTLAPARFYRRRAALLRRIGSPRSVVHGPFRGTVYPPYAADKALLPRLLGTYECELHDAVEQLCVAQPDVVAIAGAGEGYYVGGIARRVAKAKVYAYEGFRWAQHLLKKMVRLNRLQDRVSVGGLITPPELERVLQGARTPAVVCDVEGYEQQLLDPVAVPSLKHAIILLEVHEHIIPKVTEQILRRFSGTHRIEEIHDRERTLRDLPPGIVLPPEDALWGINEMQFRGVRQSWLFMQPRHRKAA
jgi:hypothetical protein